MNIVTIKITLRSNNTICQACSLPIDIFNYKMIKTVYILPLIWSIMDVFLFVTTFPRLLNQDIKPLVQTQTLFKANVSIPDIEEEVLPNMMSLQ